MATLAARSSETRSKAEPTPSVGPGSSSASATGAMHLSSAPALSLASVLAFPGAGAPLAAPVRGAVEGSTGEPLGGVRVHQDARASPAVDAAGARAVTYGSNIFLGSRESASDVGLMAHEAAHVIQQRGGGPVAQNKSAAGASDALEAEADRVSAAVQSGRAASVSGRTSGPQPQFRFGWLRRAAGAVAGGVRSAVSTVATGVREAASTVASGVRAAASAVADVAGNIIGRAVAYIKERARSIPGYDLLGFVLGRDPLTQEPVERNAMNLLRALFGLIPGGTALLQNLQQARVIERAYAWVTTELAKRNITWTRIRGAIDRFLNTLGASDLLNLGGVLARARAIFEPIVSSITGFARAAGRKIMEFIFEGAMVLAGGAAQRVLGIFRRIGETIQLIINDPVGFLRNLIEAVAGGFRLFGSNILAHLRSAIFDWLFGAMQGAGIQLPQRFDLRGIISIVLQVLGLTYDRLRLRLVRLMGEPAVRALEQGFEFLRVLVTEGIAAAWQKILEFAGNLTDMVIEGIKTWVRNTIVMQAIQQIASMLSPVGAIIQACIKIYNTVMFVIERARQIAAFVESVIDSISNIARGNLGAAKAYVERTLARILPLVISFLARFIGLGGISQRIREVIARIRAPVDRALDRIEAWIRERGRSLMSRALGGDPNAPPQQRLESAMRDAQSAVNRFAGRRVGAVVLRPLLAAIRTRHRLTSLDVVRDGSRWAIEGVVNPRRRDVSQAQVEGGDDASGATSARPTALAGKSTPNLDQLATIPRERERSVHQLYVNGYVGLSAKSKSFYDNDVVKYVEARAARKLGRYSEGPAIAKFSQQSGISTSQNRKIVEMLSERNSNLVRRTTDPLRIPDFLTPGTVVGDVKRTASLSADSQMRDDATIARGNLARFEGSTDLLPQCSRGFHLIVRGPSDSLPTGTHISGPLQTLVDNTGRSGEKKVWPILE